MGRDIKQLKNYKEVILGASTRIDPGAATRSEKREEREEKDGPSPCNVL